MKKYITRLLAAFAVAFPTMLFAIKGEPDDYLALAIENVPEKQTGGKTSAQTETGQFYDAWILLKESDCDADLKNSAKKLVSASDNEIPALVAANKDVKRAKKYLKASKLSSEAVDKSLTARVGDVYILVFEMPKDSKLRAGMNVMVFEKSADGKYLWNPSFNDPLLPLVGTSDFKNAKSADDIDIFMFTEKDEKICKKLERFNLPILCFKNAALVSMDELEKVYTTNEAKFYHKAQDVFYSWKLDSYTDFMTPRSRDKFNSQFKEMPEEERKKVLGEYFAWSKIYHKVMDAGSQKLIFFSRHKESADPYFDVAYLQVMPDNELAITKFGAEKSALDLFLSKYLYPIKSDYLHTISRKYNTTPID